MTDTETASLIIRLSVGFVHLAFGLSQFRSPDKWFGYIPGLVKFILPVRTQTFMRTHAMGNMLLGLLLISRLWLPVSVWLSLAWWIWILPFAFYSNMATGLRDCAIIASIVALLVLQ